MDKDKKISSILRQFNIGFNTLIDFLAKKGIKVKQNLNAELTDRAYALVSTEFQADLVLKDMSNRISDKVKSLRLESEAYHLVGPEFQADSTFKNMPETENFSREPKIVNPISQCVETDKRPVEIYIQFKNGANWSDNRISFSQFKSLITKPMVKCYFQKQDDDEKGRFRHKIIIPISDEEDNMAIELRVGLNRYDVDAFNSNYYYFVNKYCIVPFIQAPKEDTICARCSISIIDRMDKDKNIASDFADLCKSIQKLNVPKVDINKDKDREIWNNYVNALKKLVKQKEQVWGIEKIGNSYSEVRNNDERKTFVDIIISEQDIAEQFKEEMLERFDGNGKELENCEANERSAFIEFNSFRELSPDERSELYAIAEEYFYGINEKSTEHYIRGKIDFKFTDETDRSAFFSEIERLVYEEYQINVNIEADGTLEADQNTIPYIEKVVKDYYAPFVAIKQKTFIQRRVVFPATPVDVEKVSSVLKGSGIIKREIPLKYFSLSEDRRQVSFTVPAFVHPDALRSIGLKHVRTIFRFGNGTIPKEPVDGTYIEGNFYCSTERLSRENCEILLRKIQDKFEDLTYEQKPTKYVFEVDETADLTILKNFKLLTDTPNRSKFDIRSSILTIWADNEEEFYDTLSTIQDTCPNAQIEEKKYSPSYFVEFKTDQVEFRRSVISNIQNQIRGKNLGDIRYDPTGNYTRTPFTFYFSSEDKRDEFKRTIRDICASAEYKNILNVFIDNELGETKYSFFKNKSLEMENERKLMGNVRQATFVYITRQEYEQLSNETTNYGDNKDFRGGIKIGTLIRKDRNKLKFRITEEFDNLLISPDRNERELRTGYIKPIFPGEMTNINRMIKAMNKVTAPSAKIGYPANKNLSNFLFDPTLARVATYDLEKEKRQIIESLNEPLLKNQQKQLEAVAKALMAKDLAIIQGPPGTGKTTVIAEIIWQTLLRNPGSKILVTSQTNLAVDNALERLKGKELVRPIRIGNMDKCEDSGKVYFSERLLEWSRAIPKSKEEQSNADNAIAHWIERVRNKCSSDSTYSDIVAKWKDELDAHSNFIKSQFYNEYIGNVNVFAATCSECGSKNFGETYNSMFKKDSEVQGDPEFDLVIMDEASKATPPELVLPLTFGKKVVIIGDHKQLPPMIDEKEFDEALEAVGAKGLVENWTKADYKRSQFEKLFLNAPKSLIASLDTQFRMHKQIMDCISQFYRDQEELANGLICGIADQMDDPNFEDKNSRWHGLNYPPFITPEKHAIWVNVSTSESRVGTSYKNDGEVEAIKIVLSALKKSPGFDKYQQFFKTDEEREIGIITYYMAQMKQIRRAIYPQLINEWKTFDQHKYSNDYKLPFRINTVDRFQGMERNIVIVSTVRSNRVDVGGREEKNERYPMALGFARELQRINVGFSRAKRLLIVIGNKKHFENKLEYKEAIDKMYNIDIVQLKNL